MMLIDEISYLYYGLACLSGLVLLILIYSLWQKRVLQEAQRNPLLRVKMLDRLAPQRSKFLVRSKKIIFLLAIMMLFIALANPKIGTQLGTVRREGVDVVFAIDVSKSMLTEDIAPNRLEKAKRIVSETLGVLTGDRVGIITYAASAFPQLPITTDYGAARMFLKGVNTDMMSSQGTAIIEALKLASTYFDDSSETRRVLILLTDGEDHSEVTLGELSKIATGANIQVISVGLGSETGGPIPDNSIQGRTTYKKDRDGNVVISKMNPSYLSKLAEATQGSFILANNTEENINQIRDFLAQLDKTAFETQTYSNYKDQFQWFLAIALILLILDLLLPERKLIWRRK